MSLAVDEKKIGIAAGATTAVGGLGAAIAAFGLCPCVIASATSLLGLLSIISVFLTNNKILFLSMGVALFIISGFAYVMKRTCKIHKN